MTSKILESDITDTTNFSKKIILVERMIRNYQGYYTLFMSIITANGTTTY